MWICSRRILFSAASMDIRFKTEAQDIATEVIQEKHGTKNHTTDECTGTETASS